jgi:hypothetical protein
MQRIALVLALLETSSPPDYDRVIELEPPPAPVEPQPEPAPAPSVDGPSPSSVVIPPPPVLEVQVDPVNYRIVLAGDVLIGLGGVGFVLMGAGLVVRNDAVVQRDAQQLADQPDPAEIARQERRLTIGTTLALIGGVSAAVLMVSGIGMIIGGRTRERKRREALVIEAARGGLMLRF